MNTTVVTKSNDTILIIVCAFAVIVSTLLIINNMEQYLFSVALVSIYNVAKKDLDKLTKWLFSSIIYLQMAITGILSSDYKFGVATLVAALIIATAYILERKKQRGVK